MDIERVWQNHGRDEILDKLLKNRSFSSLTSNHPVKKLKDNLIIGIILAILITIGYCILFVKFTPWQIRLALVIVTIYNIVSIIDTWRLYKITAKIQLPGLSLREELETIYNHFMRWWKIQLRASLFIFPFAIMGGFILGGIEGSGKSVDEFLFQPISLIALAIALVIFIPASYLLSKILFNLTYGKYLKQLKSSIEELS